MVRLAGQRAFALMVFVCLVGLVGCHGEPPGLQPPREETTVVTAALNASPKLGDFIFEAQNSIYLRSAPLTVNGGDVGARGTGTVGPFLSGGVAVDLSSSSIVQSTHNIIADSIRLATGIKVGDLQTNRLVNPTSGTHGTVTALVPLPALPALAPVTAGTNNLTVAGGATVTASPGQYLTVSLGTSSVLRLNAGVYQMKDLTVGSSGRVDALGAVQIRISNRLSLGTGFCLGPASGVTLTARGVRVEVSGKNGSDGALTSTPVAASLGSSGNVRALILAPNGTLTFATGTTAKGAFMARDIDVGSSSAAYAFEDGFQGAACGTAADCNDNNPCTTDACGTNSTCTHANLASGTSCSDGNACNGAEVCNASGVCLAGTAVTCTASDQCHAAGTCAPATGVCSNPAKANGTVCNDGNACTQTDTCQSGACAGANPVTCAASDQCHTAGACNSTTGVCSNPVKANGTACNDANACTQTDTCQAGTCTGANPVACAAADQCHIAGACDPASGSCTNPVAANGTTCSDGNLCTRTDTCQAGVCAGANPVTCIASDQCHATGTCNPTTGTCSNPSKADGTSCSDGNACTQTDTCVAGACTGANPVACAAIDQCHTGGTCDSTSGACSKPVKANGTTCNDGNACTTGDACQTGTCTGAPKTCTASDQCHLAGTCDPTSGACSNPVKADTTACDDGNPCTTGDNCHVGACAGVIKTCAPLDQCHVAGTCDPGTGTCSNPVAANGTTCNDGNACTTGDACQTGACTGAPKTCVASDQCHMAGSCDALTGTCSNPSKADGTSCSDGNLCTQADTCVAGACTGSNPVACAPIDQCHTAGTCDPASGACSKPAKANGATCNDGNACTTGDACQTGTCTGAPKTCTASDQCHLAGACDSTSGACSNPPKADTTACDDGNPCTTGDACQTGACTGAPKTCTASDQCHVAGSCDASTGTCSNPSKADGTTCSDGNLCTQTDTCVAGACTGSNTVTCVATDQCHAAGTCNPTSGICSNPTQANGTSCSDGDSCTSGDVCQSGVCASGAQTCTTLSLTNSVFRGFTNPIITMDCSADKTAATPGDPVTYTAHVTNTSSQVTFGSDVTLRNNGTSTFVVRGFQETLEYFSIAQNAWVSVGGATFDDQGNDVTDASMLHIPVGIDTYGGAGCTLGPRRVATASIAPAGSCLWDFYPSAPLPPSVVNAIFNSAVSSGIRITVRFDTPGGTQPTISTSADVSARFPGVTGQVTGAFAKIIYGTIASGTGILGPTATALSSGDSVTLTGVIPAPVLAPRGTNETDTQYRDDLRNDDFYGYNIGCVADGHAVGGDPGEADGRGWHLALQIPIINVSKTGPSVGAPGLALDYTVGIQNEGFSDATSYTVTDTVDGTIVSGPTEIDEFVDAQWSATTTLSYQPPAARPAGPMTDVASVTWKDKNGNSYGPMTGTFTTNLTTGGTGNTPPHITSTPITTLARTTQDTQGRPFDLQPWTKVQYEFFDQPDANWVIDSSGTVATQTVNSDASILLSNIPVAGSHVQGTWSVNSSNDDDFIGFVFGYQDSGHFYLFDWKQANQDGGGNGVALQGMSVKIVSADTALREPDLWPTIGNGARVKTLFHNSVPWQHFQPYDFSLEYQPGHIVITVKQGSTTLATIPIDDSTYTGGAFGFYNDSQDGVVYSGFTHDLLANEDYHYGVVATDGDGDPVNYKLLSAPVGMTIDPVTGLISWETQPGAGAYSVSVEAIDAAGLTDVQTYTVTVEDNHPPVVDAGPDQQDLGVSFPVTEPLAGSVQDELGLGDPALQVTWSMVSGPAGVAFTNGSSPTSGVTFFQPGIYLLQLAANDGVSTSMDLVTVFVDSQPSLAGATLNLVASSAGPIQDGTALTLMATLRDSTAHPMQSVAVKFDVAGANAQSAYAATNASGVATYTYVGANEGTDVITATALGAGGTPTSTLPGIFWIPASAPPSLLTQGWIGAPLHQATVMGQVPVTVASGVTLTSGTLTYWPMSAPDQVHTLASGVSGGPGATIGTLDTTGLANGPWVLKLDATNDSGQELVSEVEVTVSGDYKPGRVVVEVTDMTIPVTGIPITVGRRYDSLEKDNVGDFGHGWSLTLGHPKLEVDPAHNVTITMPDNRRTTFYFQATSVTASITFAWLYGPGYVPEAGTYGTLTADGCPLMVLAGGQLVCFLESSLDYAPTTYTYTDPFGRVFTMAATGELRSIKDRQQNTLTFSPTGISSNTGVSVAFERDASGRITTVTSPTVDSTTGSIVYNYEYDANGNLVKIDLPDGGSGAGHVDYAYSVDHRLLTTKDANGHFARTSTYDTAGRLQTDTDALANVTSYAYDLTAHKTTITNPDEGTVVQTFDDRGLITKEVDPLGRTTQHTYDANRNELTRTNAAGEVSTFTYDANGNQTSITNGRAETTQITYNAQSQPLTSTDPSGHTTTINYDTSGIPTTFRDDLGTLATFTSSDGGLPLTVTDAAGNTAFFVYDGAGNLTSRTDRLGRIMKSSYDGTGRLTASTDARGGVTSYFYFPRGSRSRMTDASGLVGHQAHGYGYDQNGNLTSESTDEGRATASTFDVLNHLTKVTHADLTTTQYTRDFRGNPLTMKDESGRTTTYEYDKAGQLTKTTFPDLKFTTRAYDQLGRLVTATDERGNSTASEYETGCGCANRVTKVTDALGRATVTAYDAVGRRASVADAGGHSTSYAYDSRGHLTTTTYADGTTETDAYDARGRRTSHTDQMGSVTQFGYDAEGQLTSVTDALSHVTHYAYDNSSNLNAVTDANGHTTTYSYDRLNRKTKRTLPLGMFETFAYNMYGDSTAHVDFRGKTTTITYDALSRLLTKVPDPTLGEPTVTFTYNATGTRATMADASGSTTYGYDSRDRLLTKATPAGTLTYTYDVAGNVATIRSSNANGTSVDYAWDAANQFASVTNNRAGGVTTAAYTPTGRPSTLTQPSGVGASYSYDTRDRVSSLAWQRGIAPAFGSWSYGFNDRGQRTSVIDVTGRHVSYGYDAVSRLTSEAISADPSGPSGDGEISYSLDPAGNRLTRTSTLAALGAQTFTYDANDEMTTDGYDLNGNTTGADGHTYAYDFENRLRSKDGGAVAIVYDGDGNRVAKTVGSVTTKYLVDEVNPTGYLQVLDEVAGGVVQAEYTYGTTLVSQTRMSGVSGHTSYYGYDAHGNVTFLTDAAGAVTDTYDYDGWGNIVAQTGSTPNTRLYGSEELDPDLGLISLRARYYKSGTGRFVTVDPADGDLQVPLTLNKYLYSGANPTNLSDPLGLFYAPPPPPRTGGLEYAALLGITAALVVVAHEVYLGKNGQYEVVQAGTAKATGLQATCNFYLAEQGFTEDEPPPSPFDECKPKCPPPPPPDCAPYVDDGHDHAECLARTGSTRHWHFCTVDQGPPPMCKIDKNRRFGGCCNDSPSPAAAKYMSRMGIVPPC